MKNNINGLMYRYKQNTYLHKWLLPFLPSVSASMLFLFLDVTVANVYIK
jgi:hypothetical protein